MEESVRKKKARWYGFLFIFVAICVLIFIAIKINEEKQFVKLSGQSPENKCASIILEYMETCTNLQTNQEFTLCIIDVAFKLKNNIDCNQFDLSSPLNEQAFIDKLSWKNKREYNCVKDCDNQYQPIYIQQCMKECF